MSIGEGVLGIKMHEVGTHPIRLGAAIAMFLGQCLVYTIMMIGRWSNNAFLGCIRKQVVQFSHNVSTRMLHFETHSHIPDLASQILHLDPGQHNHPDNTETRKKVGGDLACRDQLPSFSLFS